MDAKRPLFPIPYSPLPIKMLLAYDLGTGGAKASLYENDGTLLAASFESYSTYYPQSGWHEQRPEDWRLAIIASTKKLLAETKADPNQVEAIALSGHSLGLRSAGQVRKAADGVHAHLV